MDQAKLTLYVPQELKDKIVEMARTADPRTTASGIGTYLLELGIERYLKEDKARQEKRKENLKQLMEEKGAYDTG